MPSLFFTFGRLVNVNIIQLRLTDILKLSH